MARSTIYIRAITTIIAAIPIYALTAIALYNLITSNHAGVDFATIWPFLFLAIFPVGIACVSLFFLYPLAIYAIFNPLRIMRALHDSNSAIVPPLSAQPGTDGVLMAGESLLVERVRPLISIIREMLSQIAAVFILAGMSEAFLLYFLPQQRTLLWTAITAPDVRQLVSLTIWDWITLAYPVILAVAFLLFSIRQLILTRRWFLLADDEGITLVAGGRRSSAHWGEIRAVVFNRHTFMTEHLEGEYLLSLAENRLFPLVVDPRPTQSADAKVKYRYLGGYDRYAADILRVFATIRARSFATFHYNGLGERTLKWISERAPLATLREEQIFDAPIADTSLQPQVTPVTALKEEIKVFPRLNWRPIIRNGIIFDGVILALTLIFAIPSAHFETLHISWNDFTHSFSGYSLLAIILIIFVSLLLIALILAFVGLVGALGFIFAYSQQRKRLPGLNIKDDGLVNTQRENKNDGPAIIIWRDMRAWVLMPANDRRPYDTYVILYGEKGKFYWRANSTMQLAGRKVEGDRQAVFQERLREAHAVIAAKTGLPLRIYSPRTP